MSSSPGFACLSGVSQAITASLDEVLDCVARAAIDLLPGSSARIWVMEGGQLRLKTEAGTVGPPGLGRKTVLAEGEGLTGHVARARMPLMVDRVIDDPRTVNHDWMRQQGFVSFIGLPLRVREDLVGVLALHTRHAHHFTADEVEILASFGAQAGIAIENARLYQEARDARDVLRSREAFISNVVANLAEGLVVLDREGRVVTCNRAMERICGATAEATHGLSYRQALAKLGTMLSERLERLLAGDTETFALDGLEYHRPDREPLVLNLKASLLREQGAPAGAALLVEDITATAGLQRAARQAEKMAALGVLCAGTAHEINNPVGIITSRIQLMLLEANGAGGPAGLREDLEVLGRNAQRIARITQSLLGFARPSLGPPTPVDLNRVVQDSLVLAEGQLARHGVAVRSVLTPDLPPLLGDANALQQVVMNLFANAQDAMPEGGEIRVATRREEGAPGRLRLVVSDTGTGIAPEHVPRLFEPFFTTKEHGTGLGLSVSYGIVRDHQGTMDVQSDPGKGATFVLTFPALVPLA